jgi:cytochrome oxidase Cu insertion factor (SCO1/SenC/PrrC family)
MKNLIRINLVLFFFLVAFAPLKAQTQTNEKKESLANVFTLKLKDLDDKAFSLKSFEGNVLLISFGATWCFQCVPELQALEELKTEYKDKPVKFVWISVDETYTTNAEVRAFAKRVNFNFQILRDYQSINYLKYSNRFRLPTILFATGDGTVLSPIQFGMFPTSEEYKKYTRRRLNQMLQPETPTK